MSWFEFDLAVDFLKSLAMRSGQLVAEKLPAWLSQGNKKNSEVNLKICSCQGVSELKTKLDIAQKELARKERQLWEYQQITRHFVELSEQNRSDIRAISGDENEWGRVR